MVMEMSATEVSSRSTFVRDRAAMGQSFTFVARPSVPRNIRNPVLLTPDLEGKNI